MEKAKRQIREIIGDEETANAVIAIVERAEQERVAARRRKLLEGIDAAKQRGVAFGRPKTEMPVDFVRVFLLQRSGEITRAKAAQLLGISPYLYRKMAASCEKELEELEELENQPE